LHGAGLSPRCPVAGAVATAAAAAAGGDGGGGGGLGRELGQLHPVNVQRVVVGHVPDHVGSLAEDFVANITLVAVVSRRFPQFLGRRRQRCRRRFLLSSMLLFRQRPTLVTKDGFVRSFQSFFPTLEGTGDFVSLGAHFARGDARPIHLPLENVLLDNLEVAVGLMVMADVVYLCLLQQLLAASRRRGNSSLLLFPVEFFGRNRFFVLTQQLRSASCEANTEESGGFLRRLFRLRYDERGGLLPEDAMV